MFTTKLIYSRPEKCVPCVSVTSLLLHAFGCLMYGYTIYFERYILQLKIFEFYGGRAQFLTMINLYGTFFATGYAVAIDIIQLLTSWLEDRNPTKEGYFPCNSLLLTIRNELISFWAYTLSVLVTVMYWSIIAVDVEGMHSAEFRKMVPLFGWWNQMCHTFPLIYANLLIILINYEYISRKKALIYAILYGIGYLTWLVHCYQVNGFWAYFFLAKLSVLQFAIFVVFTDAAMFLVFLLGKMISSIVWTKDRKNEIIKQQERKDF